jgi:dTDP-glucose 4,6-dehydratase
MKKILVLGSNSFAGSAFIDYALNEGSEVTGISRSQEPNDVNLVYSNNFERETKFSFHQLDINNDFDEMTDIISNIEPEIIVDFAGQGMVSPSWEWPEQWYQTNIVAKVRLHNYLKSQKYLEQYVRVSTPEVFGDCKGLINEDAVYNPSTPYAVSHAAIDMSLKAFEKQYSFPVLFTRFANFYGPSQQLYRIIPKTIICALTGETLFLHGGGHSVRAFIHGHDVSNGIWKTIKNGKLGESYHFSTTEFIKIHDLVKLIADELNVDLKKFVKISDELPGKDQAYFMDSSKAQHDLGWKPSYDLKTGIEETILWVKKNIDIIKSLPNNYIHRP